jgi:hypothetical protein
MVLVLRWDDEWVVKGNSEEEQIVAEGAAGKEA